MLTADHRGWVRSVRGSALCAVLFTLAVPARAQQLRGTVADSTSRLGISAAVVTVLDSVGGLLARGITNERGAFGVAWLPHSHRLRVVRIGFRPREILLGPASGSAPIAIAMFPLPTMLEPARVDARDCPRRADAEQALGLWEQVRAGLLATIVAREQNPGALVLLDYERVHQGIDDDIVRFSVKRDSTARSLNSYKAVHAAADFVRLGFASGEVGQERDYYAPDADVLVDGSFASGYCFRILRGERSRPNQVGLGFESPNRAAGRVDIAGALWVDTLARAIKDIDFRYIGIHARIDALRPGGNIAFREMPNGQTLIDRWHIRMIGNRPDSFALRTSRGGDPRAAINAFYSVVAGGELAHGRWPDGAAYDSDLGHAVITARTYQGMPAAGRTIALADTPFYTILDSASQFTVPDLLPGPYRVIVHEPRLAALGIDSITSRLSFVARRGETFNGVVAVPTLEEWLRDRCAGETRFAPTDTSMVLVRLVDVRNTPIWGASIVVATQRSDAPPNSWSVIRDGGRTGRDGLFQVCSSRLIGSAPRIRISGRLPDGEPFAREITLNVDNPRLLLLTIPRVVQQ